MINDNKYDIPLIITHIQAPKIPIIKPEIAGPSRPIIDSKRLKILFMEIMSFFSTITGNEALKDGSYIDVRLDMINVNIKINMILILLSNCSNNIIIDIRINEAILMHNSIFFRLTRSEIKPPMKPKKIPGIKDRLKFNAMRVPEWVI
ncbi:hypothetical protein AP20H10_12710 [Apilactobacillus apinorum]|uniref:Uncharacterized protein n=1 Tax=Apilactobacillus apinorum TaxID=1218495 RepID=A0ABP9ZJC5_9LACO